MDLSVHAKNDDKIRTIFEDAEYFSKGYSYKLMPITFESVNETIIHIEHNYCRWMPSDISESNESHNSAMHEEVEERNYKKRKIKSLSVDNNSTSKGCEMGVDESIENLSPGRKSEEFLSNPKVDEDCGISVQPLDLSLPLLQEQKTDKTLTENQSNIPKVKSDTKNSPDKKQLNLHESNKENVTSSSKKIEVTISRPGQKGYYEPCEVFLNDLARISPDLIKNDCHEIEIIDRTHSQDFKQEVNRTYYIVLESTWRIFENSTERIILTNDLNIGQPIQNNEKYDKPRYLIFDQYSLTESLAEICESKGGSFEYTCLEEPKEQSKVQDNGKQESVKSYDDSGNDHGSDCLKKDVNYEPENRDCFTNTNEEGKEKVSDDCANGLGNTNFVETTLSGNSDNKVKCLDEEKTGKLDPDRPFQEEFPKIPELPFLSEDKDSTELKDENEICDCNLSNEPVKSVGLNLAFSEPFPNESEKIGNECDSRRSPVEGAAELKRELVNEEKSGSDTGSGETSCFSQSEPKGTKRIRVSKENNCAISEKIKKLNTSSEVENMTENEKVQKNMEDIDREEKTGEDLSSSPHPTVAVNDAPPLGNEEIGEAREENVKCLPKNESDKEESGKVADVKVKGKRGRPRKKISCTDIKTRSTKEVSVLRNGKQRCPSSGKGRTTVKQEREKIDSVKISRVKSERAENILKTKARTRKSTCEESKKICLRKRT